MTRIYVDVDIRSIDPNGLTLSDFQKLHTEFENDYLNIHIHGEYYGYDGGCEYTLRGSRLENDQEYNIRLAREQAEQARLEKIRLTNEAKEKKEYMRLKKKYG